MRDRAGSSVVDMSPRDRELGYAGPDAAARSLRTRRAGAIGVIFTVGLSYAFAALVLDGPERPSAIVADSDVLAGGVLEAVRLRGLQPGRDISVTGFDDASPAGPAGLTTVRQPIRERGRLMGRMLLDPTFTTRRVVLPTELVVRSSTGPAPASGKHARHVR